MELPSNFFNIDTLKNLLPHLDNQSLEMIKTMARNMGISENEIKEGVNKLELLRNSK